MTRSYFEATLTCLSCGRRYREIEFPRAVQMRTVLRARRTPQGSCRRAAPHPARCESARKRNRWLKAPNIQLSDVIVAPLDGAFFMRAPAHSEKFFARVIVQK
jgi:hypothetical protein